MTTTTIYTSLNIVGNEAASISFWDDLGGTIPANANLDLSPGDDEIIFLQSSILTPKMGYTLQGISLVKTSNGSGPPTLAAPLTCLGSATSFPGNQDFPPSGTFDPAAQNQFVLTYLPHPQGQQTWQQMPNPPFRRAPGNDGIYIEDNNQTEAAYQYYLYVGWKGDYYVCDPQIYNRGH